MIKLIASDLDGTLLQRGNQAVDQKLFPLINQMSQENQLFVIASGRQYANLRRMFEPVADKISYICENGALVIHKNQVISKQIIPRKLGILLIEFILDLEDCEVLISGEKTSYLKPKNEEYLIYIRDILKNNVTIIEHLDEIEEDFLKISLYHSSGISPFLQEFLNENFSHILKTATAGENWFDFTNSRANKGQAIQLLAKRLKIDKSEMMAFGDQANDIEMLQQVEYSYAMNNAIDEVKNISRYQSENVVQTINNLIIRGIL